MIIPTKWLFHWGYTPFPDIPTSDVEVKANSTEDVDVFGHSNMTWKTSDNRKGFPGKTGIAGTQKQRSWAFPIGKKTPKTPKTYPPASHFHVFHSWSFFRSQHGGSSSQSSQLIYLMISDISWYIIIVQREIMIFGDTARKHYGNTEISIFLRVANLNGFILAVVPPS